MKISELDVFFGECILKELALNEANLKALVGIPGLIQSKRKRRRRGKTAREGRQDEKKKGKMKTRSSMM